MTCHVTYLKRIGLTRRKISHLKAMGSDKKRKTFYKTMTRCLYDRRVVQPLLVINSAIMKVCEGEQIVR
jgi:hypothetical protein